VVADLCRKPAMSSATFYAWKSEYGGLELSEARRLRGLEEVSFNGRTRHEPLTETLFTSLAQAREAVAAWTDDYNAERPRSALGYATPAAYAAGIAGHARFHPLSLARIK
jgi:transposase InsO family protein